MIGFIAPILRYALFGVPVLFPMGISMAFELATYGLMTGILYRLLPKRIPYVYLALVSSMLVGRIVWGMTSFIIAGLQHTEFSFDMFLAGAFINALPGIVIHIVLIPLVVIVLKKANLMADE
jgi:hypothetical protein